MDDTDRDADRPIWDRSLREEMGSLPTGAPSGRVRIVGAEQVGPPGEAEAAAPEPGGTADVWSGPADAGDPDDSAADDGGAARAEPPADDAAVWAEPPAEPALPHWTEAPTGEVPAVVARDRGTEGGTEDPWASLPAPTWREEGSDWEAHEDVFEPAMLAADDPSMSDRHETLDEERQPWTFDLSTARGADGSATPPPEAPAGLDAVADDETVVVPVVAARLPSGSGVADPVDGGGAAAEAAAPVEVPDADSGVHPLQGDDPLVAGQSGIAPPARGRVGRDRRRHPRAERGAAAAEEAGPVAARPVPPAPSETLVVRARPPLRPPPPRPAAAGSGPVLPPGADTPRPSRNLPVAVIAGVVLGLAVVVAFDLGTVLAMVVVTAAAFLATVEAFSAFRHGGYRPATLLGWVATVSLMVATYNKGLVALPLVLVLTTVLTMFWYVAGVEPGADPIRGAAVTLFVFCWVGVFASFAALLLNPTLFPDKHGLAFLMGAIITTIAYDVAALAVGTWIGSRSLAPTISPGKTWEGAIGGGVAAVLAGVIVVRFFHPWTPASAAVLGLVVAVVAPLGDLFESVVKRQLGLKDMGRLLPGHGGILDRVDGLLFVLPATYYLVKAFHLG